MAFGNDRRWDWTMLTLWALALGCAPLDAWTLRRFVAKEQERAELLLAKIPLPEAASGGAPLTPGLVIAVDSREVHVLDAGWPGVLDNAPLSDRPQLSWIALSPLPLADEVTLIEPLKRVLEARAEARRAPDARTGRFDWQGDYSLHADASLPFGVIASVLYTAGQAGWSRADLRFASPDGVRVVLHEAPGYCGESEAIGACNLITLRQAPSGLHASLQPSTDAAGCGVAALIGQPEPALTPPLGDAEAVRRWALTTTGTTPLCEDGILVVEASQRWGDTLALRVALAQTAPRWMLGVDRVDDP